MRLFSVLILALASALCFAPAVAAEEPASVQPDLAELPHWTFGLRLPDELIAAWNEPRAARDMARPGAHVLGWVPPAEVPVRAVLMIANNTDLVRIGEYAPLRTMAARQGLAILYLRSWSGQAIERAEPPELAEASFTALLEAAATATNRPEFRNAPWVTIGKSSRGRFPFRTAWWFPDRVVASIAYHGETPSWPMPSWSRAGGDETVLHLNIQGLSEWDGTWFRHVRPSLLNYHRHTNWLAHQMVIYGVDHGYYMDYFLYPNHGARLEKDHRFTRVTQVWDYITAFIASSIALRVPAELPAEGPVPLRSVSRDSGYLIHPRAPEELLGTKWFAWRQNEAGDHQVIPWPDEVTPVFAPEQGVIPREQLIRRAIDVPEAERREYLWIADRALLKAWLNLHNLYNTADPLLKAVPELP